WQHYFEAAYLREVVSIRRVPQTALHGVADQAAIRTGTGRFHPQAGLALLQELMQSRLRNTWLHRHISEFFAEIDNAVQTAEIEDRGAIDRRNARAGTPIIST